MLGRDLIIKTLMHYCDIVWEYDYNSDRIYIHHDKVASICQGKWFSTDDLIAFFKDNYVFGIDSSAWDMYLNRDYIRGLFRFETQKNEFYLRFSTKNGSLKWYDIYIERVGDSGLIISGRNIYEDIKEKALYITAKKSFDGIINIDVETRVYMTTFTSVSREPSHTAIDYNCMMTSFVKTHCIESEQKSIIRNMDLDNVIEKLETQDEYEIFATMKAEENAEISYKKMVFSYLDSKKRIITLARIDVSGVVKRYEEQLRQFKKETFRDTLTGAYNRNFYEESVKSMVMRAGVAIIDLDDFKLCNDTYGHSVGDLALTELASVICDYTSENDLFIRYGGDEFLLVMPGISEEAFEKTLEQIRRQIYEARIPTHPDLRLSVSVGGVVCRGESIKAAVFRADKNMYQAKSRKNMVVTENSHIGIEDAPMHGGERKLEQQVLIVDDSEMNRSILSEMLQEDFRILEASNGNEGIDLIEQYGTGISAVLLDIVMPVMDGYQVLVYMNRNHYIEDIPVVMISSEDSDTNIRRAYDLGVSDYISRPFDAKVVCRRVFNTIKLYAKQRRLTSMVVHQAHEKVKYNNMMIDILSQIVGFKNGESGPHVLHINSLTKMLLEKLITKTNKYNLTWQECSLIETASTPHDIGKIGIDDKILNKPGKLTPEEVEIIKTHTVLGESILKDLDEYQNEPLVKTAEAICRWHHERYDGAGYPDGLKGDEIPISAQVVSVADVYDALVSPRVYKKPIPCDKAVQMILNGECGAFNPILLECLDQIKDKIKINYYSLGEKDDRGAENRKCLSV